MPLNTGHALVYLNMALIARLLDVPDGVQVRAIFVDGARQAIGVHLEGPHLPACEDGTVPPCGRAEVLTRHVFRDGDGVDDYDILRIVLELPQAARSEGSAGE